VVGEQGGNIDELQLLKREGASDFFDLTMLLEVFDNKHLNDIINGLKAKSSVSQVARMTG
jgi:(p)ppGpp synthase/HD superfamily hydrolase